MYSALMLILMTTPDYTTRTVVRERHTVTNSAGCQGVSARASGCQGNEARVRVRTRSSGGCVSHTASNSGCEGNAAGRFFNREVGSRFRDREPLLQRRAANEASSYRTYTTTRSSSHGPYRPPIEPMPWEPKSVAPRSSSEQTSPRIASIAARYLRGDETVTVAEIRAVMASALTQAADR